MNIEELPEPCREKDLAKFFGISVFTVRVMCEERQITYRKIRNRRVFMREDIKEYLEVQKCQRETEDSSLNGGKSVVSGKSSGTSGARRNASLQARKTALRLIGISRSTRRGPAKESVRGSSTTP